MNKEMIKNIPHSMSVDLATLTDYSEGRVVSRTIAQNNYLSMTLFAIDAGEGISEHTTAGDALVHILDGKALITIGGKPTTVEAGKAIVMPANVPHALDAKESFKMLLVVVKENSLVWPEKAD